MNTATKRWVGLLESGKYEQAKSRLRKVVKGKPRYCCLGVAAEGVLGCEIARDDCLISEMGDTEAPHLLDDLGISLEDEWALAVVNDGDKRTIGMNFEEIATLICLADASGWSIDDIVESRMEI